MSNKNVILETIKVDGYIDLVNEFSGLEYTVDEVECVICYEKGINLNF